MKTSSDSQEVLLGRLILATAADQPSEVGTCRPSGACARKWLPSPPVEGGRASHASLGPAGEPLGQCPGRTQEAPGGPWGGEPGIKELACRRRSPPPLMGGKVRAAGERGRSRAGEPLLDWGGQLLGPGPIRVWVAEVSHRKGRIGGGIPHWICFVACGRTGFFFLTLRLFSPAETQKSTPLWEPF